MNPVTTRRESLDLRPYGRDERSRGGGIIGDIDHRGPCLTRAHLV